MKSMIMVFASSALAIFSLSIPAPIFTIQASADGRMTGAANCAGGVCTKVTCPAKTCSPTGSSIAYDTRYCSAANCRKKN
jgi:hypothetical protein